LPSIFELAAKARGVGGGRATPPAPAFRDRGGFPGFAWRATRWPPGRAIVVVVPAGKFTMGSPEGERGLFGEKSPQHEVIIAKPFAVGKQLIENAGKRRHRVRGH
jgi:hypothetical protein